MNHRPKNAGGVLPVWIYFCAYLNAIGWLLSAIGQLNSSGYAGALLFLGGGVWFFRDQLAGEMGLAALRHRMRRRFKRVIPRLFLAAAAFIFLGGLWHAPNNYDAVTYRLPRVLNWLAAEHWFWIPTINTRMNFSGPAWEWLAAPQVAILHSDRGLFLINLIGFLLLPGLIFSVFRQVGISRRVAWVWMWLLPLGYGYATQAGGLGNDITGTVFCLASVHFGLRARNTGNVQDVWLAILAAALMTAVKLSNLPLALPCLIAMWPSGRLVKHSLVASFGVAMIAITISALPIMGLNTWFTGNWGGDPENLHQVQVKSPTGALVGNSLQLLQQSFLPPVLPQAHEVNRRLNQLLPTACHDFLHREFPRYYLGNFSELPSEENAGLGLGISATLVFLLIFALLHQRRPAGGWKSPSDFLGRLVGLAAWVAFSVYMLKMGSEATARLLLPYYPLLLIPILKLSVQETLLRFRAWKMWLVLVALSVFPALILSPARPLWPALTISRFWQERQPDSGLAHRLVSVYAGYSTRNDPLKPLRDALPLEARKIGWVAGSNDTGYSLWRPFGRRTVVDLRWNPTGPGLRLPSDVGWVVIRKSVWEEAAGVPLVEWCERHHAQIILTANVVVFVGRGPEEWCLLHREGTQP